MQQTCLFIKRAGNFRIIVIRGHAAPYSRRVYLLNVIPNQLQLRVFSINISPFILTTYLSPPPSILLKGYSSPRAPSLTEVLVLYFFTDRYSCLRAFRSLIKILAPLLFQLFRLPVADNLKILYYPLSSFTISRVF